MKHFKILLLLLVLNFKSIGQDKISSKNAEHLADSLYQAKNYLSATSYYLQQAVESDFNHRKAGAYYNAACCLALQNKKDSAFTYLKKSIKTGYSNKENLVNDKDFTSLHSSTKWQKMVNSVKEDKKILNDDPAKARFITDDVHRFWKAYDKAYSDTLHFDKIFKANYFDKASKGMDDYMSSKVSDINFFTTHIRSAPQFYHSIRQSTFEVDNFKKDFLTSFQKLKDLYPPAKFPDVYFVIGAFTSGGTVSNAGLLIGVNQVSQTDNTPIEELSFRLRTRLNKIKYLPNLIAHELIHFQQGGIKNDTITLGYAIKEGMADFIGELISGSTANSELFKWAEGKEKAIWNNFKNDMYFNRYNNWIANSSKSTADNLPDQGYWVGYQICKAYYEKAEDKKQAIYDMLNIKDYRKFLNESGWEDKVNSLK
jgi:hypothetical protein